VVEFRDIEVLMTGGRGGKGTTLFKVEPKGTTNQPCSFDFVAVFDDDPGDGLRSQDDAWLYDYEYDAIGGMGFRLDTNDGSQHLERQNDDRFVRIDFSVNNDDWECKYPTEYNPEGAAGFCTKEKGVDMRLEHWAQDPDFCLVEEGKSKPMVFVVMFEAEPGYKFDNSSKNGKQSGNGSLTLWLNYGCISPNLLQGDADPEGMATVTNLGNGVWRIEGTQACLHTWLGNKLKDSDSPNEPATLLNMPFGLTIRDVETLR
jgi:hypothetical protein